MMHSAMEYGTTGWLMIAAHVATFGIVALLGAAAVKYLFFDARGNIPG
jgi:hypothetical protein